MTDTDKLEKITRIIAINTDNANDDGDRYLSDADYAVEAISNVIEGIRQGALKMFEEAGA
jgi:hypothetical protein